MPHMWALVAKTGSEPVGFAIYWKIENWYFLEHLAVHPQQEDKGYGSKILQQLLQNSENKMLLEAELPTNDAGQKRIRFYEKAGFQIAPFFYQQPPYRLGEATPAMHILSIPQLIDADAFANITTAIRQQVFEAFY